MANILLLGAGGNAGINFTKCVHKGGHKVIGIDINNYYLDTCNADEKVGIGSDDKVGDILEIINHFRVDMIHAQPDNEVKWLLSQPELEKYRFPHSLEMWKKFSNKLYCQDIWTKRIPFSTYSFLECSLKPHLFEKMKYKGGGKVWVRAIQGAGSKAALPITSFTQAENWINYWEEARGINQSDFMLCQYLPGREYAVQTLWKDGQLIHSQQRERLVYFFGALMPSGQTSTPAVAKITNDKDVYSEAYAAIKDIDCLPNGIYCVDIKRDINGIPIPMEVNYGRFFTTSDFFAEVGVNTPLDYVNMFLHQPFLENMEKVTEPYYWIRGLDKEPKLIKYE